MVYKRVNPNKLLSLTSSIISNDDYDLDLHWKFLYHLQFRKLWYEVLFQLWRVQMKPVSKNVKFLFWTILKGWNWPWLWVKVIKQLIVWNSLSLTTIVLNLITSKRFWFGHYWIENCMKMLIFPFFDHFPRSLWLQPWTKDWKQCTVRNILL